MSCVRKKTVCRLKKIGIEEDFLCMIKKPCVVYIFERVHDLSSKMFLITCYE